jgi:hypothetical protein
MPSASFCALTRPTPAIVVAGAALLVGMASAGYSAVRLATLRPVRRAGS